MKDIIVVVMSELVLFEFVISTLIAYILREYFCSGYAICFLLGGLFELVAFYIYIKIISKDC